MADLRPHAHHDRFAIVGASGGGTLPGTVTSCPACGALYADLLTIRDAIRSAWLPTRPRDLRLSATTAAGLRPSGWRRLIGAIGSSRDAVTRPLALGLVSLGLAGLLLTAVPAAYVPFGSAGAAPPASSATGGVAPAVGVVGTAREPTELSTGVDSEHVETTASDSSDRRMLVMSGVLLASGGSLFILRRVTSRSTATP